MPLPSGTQLGSYELLGMIGAGGMGEVYKARDAKLDRWVAIKVLPADLAENRDFLARFEREAKAVAALSHPNVLGIFDLASQDGTTYAVMELLEGESLREKLKAGPLPPKRAVEIATELAQGLGAAHQRGIVHRDVKPDNVFLTRDGRVKVLDFGLAKLAPTPRGGLISLVTEALSSGPEGTEAGMLLGTAAYMSPEQVRGEAADHRADIFAFGVVLYEMLAGRRPFHGETAMHTMTAILDAEPPPLLASRGAIAPALERIVAHCLEKHPEARFQSMKDIAFALQSLSTASSGGGPPAAPRSRRRSSLLTGLAGAAAVLLLLGLAWVERLVAFGGRPATSFTRLTFAPGTVESAFFGPDGRTVYFSERVQGGRPEVYVLHPGTSEAKPLGLADALVLGVSADNQLALLRHPEPFLGRLVRGTLAQVDGGGGPVRELRGQVQDAGWDGAGQVILDAGSLESETLEFPAGRPLLTFNPTTRSIVLPRLAPDRQHLAAVDADTISKTEIVCYDRSGHRQVLLTKLGDAEGDTFTGLAWGPDGDLWFSEIEGDQTNVWALNRRGRRRLLWSGEGTKSLMDVAGDGRMLLADQQVRRGVLVQRPGEAVAREVSVGASTQAMGLSADGRQLLLMESPVLDGGTRQDQVYLSRMDGTPALRLGRGTCQSISPDGRWIMMQYSGFTAEELDPAVAAAIRKAGMEPKAVLDSFHPAACLIFVATGLERPMAMALPASFGDIGRAFLSQDGQHCLFNASEAGQLNWFLLERAGGTPRRISQPGFGGMSQGLWAPSPDWTRAVLMDDSTGFHIQPMTGGKPQPVSGLKPGERILGWARDGRAVFARSPFGELQVTVTRVELAAGGRREVFRFRPPDASGLLRIRSVFTDLDGDLFAMTYLRQLSQLYLVEGVQ